MTLENFQSNCCFALFSVAITEYPRPSNVSRTNWLMAPETRKYNRMAMASGEGKFIPEIGFSIHS